MKIIKILFALIAATAVFMSFSVYATDKKEAVKPAENSGETKSVEDILKGFSAKSIYVCETTTGKALFEKNAGEKVPASHSAKLMTLLIAAEKIHNGDIDLKDTVVVSEYANSMEGSQIWLDKGEKISVEELIKSITVGNANDACVTLAEKISGSEKDFVKEMNTRAKTLGMESTHFADCTGISVKSVSTAEDIAKLCGRLTEYEEIKAYVNTWMDSVRGGKAELVNLNRLVRSYKGINGMKAWGSEATGSCICACAKRGNMSICAVVLNCKSNEDRDSEARKLLDMGYEYYELFTPKIDEKFLDDIPVTGGETDSISVKLGGVDGVVIPKGSSYSVETEYEKTESFEAPVKQGEYAGHIIYRLGDNEIARVELNTNDSVEKMNVKCGLKKLWLNLLNL